VTDAPEGLPADPRDALLREQAARLKEQAEKIAALEALVADLREQLETLLREKSRNSGNSSLPPSSDDAVPGRKQPSRQQRRAAERAEGKKKRGKQPGSPGASMTWEVADRTEDHYPQGACSCGTDLAGAQDLGVTRSYQQEEVPVPESERVQHDLHQVKCAGCGKEHCAPRPPGVPASALSIGPRLRALAVYLVIHQHVPVDRCRQLIADVTGADVSCGFVHSCLKKASSLAAGTVALIRKLIAASPVAGFDETTLRAGPAGEKKYVHGAFTGEYSAFWLGTRGLDTMEAAGILPGFAGIAVTDRYANYWNPRWERITGHQACCSHYPENPVMPMRRVRRVRAIVSAVIVSA
jgi:transposase